MVLVRWLLVDLHCPYDGQGHLVRSAITDLVFELSRRG